MLKRRNKGEGSVYYSDSKKLWICQVTLGYEPQTGKQIRKTLYAKTKSDLIEKKKEFEKRNALIKDTNITFDENFYKYLYLIKKPDLKPKSWERYEGLYKNYISHAPFSYIKLKDLSYSDIQMWYKQSGITKSSLEIINRLIKASLNIAVKDKIISENIMKESYIKYKPKNTDYNVFTVKEQQIFINYLNSCSIKQEPFKYLFLFALGTGARLGEILALNKNDIVDNAVNINKSLHRIKKDNKYIQEITTPKTEQSERQIPLPKKIINLLDEILNTDGNLLFPDEKTNTYIFINRPLRRLQAICKKLNINQISFHGLRHTYATRLFESNIQIKTVQKLMGHTDIQTTMNIYTHVMPNIIDDAVESLNKFL